MEIRHYTAATLEAELRAYEHRYGMGSAEFYEAYCADGVPLSVPYHDGFVWADTYAEFGRIRATPLAQTA